MSTVPFEIEPSSFVLLRITAVKTSLFMEDQRGTRRVSCVRRCDERTRVNTRINKSLFRALVSSTVVFPVISPHLLFCQPLYLLPWKFDSKSAGLLNAYTWTGKNWMQYSASHVATIRLSFCPKMSSEAISDHPISKIFLGEHVPTPP